MKRYYINKINNAQDISKIKDILSDAELRYSSGKLTSSDFLDIKNSFFKREEYFAYRETDEFRIEEKKKGKEKMCDTGVHMWEGIQGRNNNMATCSICSKTRPMPWWERYVDE